MTTTHRARPAPDDRDPLTDAERYALSLVADPPAGKWAARGGLALATLARPVRAAVERLAAAGRVTIRDGAATLPCAPPDPLVFVAVRLPASLVRRLDAAVAARRAAAPENRPTRSHVVRVALTRGLAALAADRGEAV